MKHSELKTLIREVIEESIDLRQLNEVDQDDLESYGADYLDDVDNDIVSNDHKSEYDSEGDIPLIKHSDKSIRRIGVELRNALPKEKSNLVFQIDTDSGSIIIDTYSAIDVNMIGSKEDQIVIDVLKSHGYSEPKKVDKWIWKSDKAIQESIEESAGKVNVESIRNQIKKLRETIFDLENLLNVK